MIKKSIETQIESVGEHLKLTEEETPLSNYCLNLLRKFASNDFQMEQAYLAIFNLTTSNSDQYLERALLSIAYDILEYLRKPSIDFDSVDWAEFLKLNCN